MRGLLLHQAPGIPEQEFLLVLGGQIMNQPILDKPPPLEGWNRGEAKLLWSSLASAAPLPRLSRNDELVAWHVKCTEPEMIGLPMEVAQLRVHQPPAPLFGIPILCNRVVFMEIREDIGGKSDPHT